MWRGTWDGGGDPGRVLVLGLRCIRGVLPVWGSVGRSGKPSTTAQRHRPGSRRAGAPGSRQPSRRARQRQRRQPSQPARQPAGATSNEQRETRGERREADGRRAPGPRPQHRPQAGPALSLGIISCIMNPWSSPLHNGAVCCAKTIPYPISLNKITPRKDLTP
jgi:hypothetical protein